MDSDSDLVKQARDLAASGTDLYALLHVDPTAPTAEISRAWRKQGLLYHPDKAREHYDQALYESLEVARNILTLGDARLAYDNAIAASKTRAIERNQMDAKRRAMVDELEAAEAAGRKAQELERARRDELDREKLRMRAELEERRRQEDVEWSRQQRQAGEAKRRELREEDDRLARRERELEEMLRERKKLKAERKASKRAKREEGRLAGGNDETENGDRGADVADDKGGQEARDTTQTRVKTQSAAATLAADWIGMAREPMLARAALDETEKDGSASSPQGGGWSSGFERLVMMQMARDEVRGHEVSLPWDDPKMPTTGRAAWKATLVKMVAMQRRKDRHSEPWNRGD